MDYRTWLFEEFAGDCELTQEMYEVLNVLHETNFIAVDQHDMDRYLDGLEIRNIYTNESMEMAPEVQVSILEVIYAMGLRMEMMTHGIDAYDEHMYWGRILLDNLTLHTGMTTLDLRMHLHHFIAREYDFDGTGGLFPLPNTVVDMRNLPLWDQMNLYLEKNVTF